MASILLIEDMRGVRESLKMILKMSGHTVSTAEDGKEGLEAVEAGQFDLVITDILMPEMDGSEVIMALRRDYPDLPVIAISGGGIGVDATQALTLARHVAHSVIEKPFSKDTLLECVNEALHAEN